MKIARIIYPIKVLGPGSRVGIWVAGCNHKCKGCSNPELWSTTVSKNIPNDIFLEIIGDFFEKGASGITITGGEPFDQADELLSMINIALQFTDDILVYTGYTLEELYKMKNKPICKILGKIAVLIDGEYIEERNTGLPLRGSDNQIIHYMNNDYRPLYQKYINSIIGYSPIQNFYSQNSIISVGIHLPRFNKELDLKMSENGIIKEEDLL